MADRAAPDMTGRPRPTERTDRTTRSRPVHRFTTREDGAVTVDWVVLCAAIVGLAVLISTGMTTNAVNLGDLVADFMTNWSFD